MLSNNRKYQKTAVLTRCTKAAMSLYLLMGMGGCSIAPVQGLSKDHQIAAVQSEVSSPAPKPIVKENVKIEVAEVQEPKNDNKKEEKPFHNIIMDAAGRYQVEPEIIMAIIMAESSFNPKAVSRCGARGLMQLMPRTAKYLGVKDSFDPTHNIDGGVRYFKKLLKRFDDNVELALAAYNAGCGNVSKYGGIPPFKETTFYIKKVLKYYEIYKTDKPQDGPSCLT